MNSGDLVFITLRIAGVFLLFNLPLALLLLVGLSMKATGRGPSPTRFRAVARAMLIIQGLLVGALFLFNAFMWRISSQGLAASTELDREGVRAASEQAVGIFLVAPLLLFAAPFFAALVWFALSSRRSRAYIRCSGPALALLASFVWW
jgi:hypothetical protein